MPYGKSRIENPRIVWRRVRNPKTPIYDPRHSKLWETECRSFSIRWRDRVDGVKVAPRYIAIDHRIGRAISQHKTLAAAQRVCQARAQMFLSTAGKARA